MNSMKSLIIILCDKPVLAAGMADYNKLYDDTFNSVFIKADEKMYDRKKDLKSLGVTTR